MRLPAHAVTHTRRLCPQHGGASKRVATCAGDARLMIPLGHHVRARRRERQDEMGVALQAANDREIGGRRAAQHAVQVEVSRRMEQPPRDERPSDGHTGADERPSDGHTGADERQRRRIWQQQQLEWRHRNEVQWQRQQEAQTQWMEGWRRQARGGGDAAQAAIAQLATHTAKDMDELRKRFLSIQQQEQQQQQQQHQEEPLPRQAAESRGSGSSSHSHSQPVYVPPPSHVAPAPGLAPAKPLDCYTPQSALHSSRYRARTADASPAAIPALNHASLGNPLEATAAPMDGAPPPRAPSALAATASAASASSVAAATAMAAAEAAAAVWSGASPLPLQQNAMAVGGEGGRGVGRPSEVDWLRSELAAYTVLLEAAEVRARESDLKRADAERLADDAARSSRTASDAAEEMRGQLAEARRQLSSCEQARARLDSQARVGASEISGLRSQLKARCAESDELRLQLARARAQGEHREAVCARRELEMAEVRTRALAMVDALRTATSDLSAEHHSAHALLKHHFQKLEASVEWRGAR